MTRTGSRPSTPPAAPDLTPTPPPAPEQARPRPPTVPSPGGTGGPHGGAAASAGRWPGVLALALGGFAIGLTEFIAMGLLPYIADDLMPALYATSPETAVARCGWVITTYGLGVVVGAPLIAASSARLPRRTLVVLLLVLFTAGSVASAAAPGFAWLLVARFVAGLPHGAYFGAAGMIAADLMGPGNQGKGYAAVLSGLTIANVVGIPVITVLGQQAGWRWAYVAIAAAFALTLAAVLAVVPRGPAPTGASPRDELRALASGRVWLAAGVATIGFAGFFGVNSYISPVTTEVTGLGAGAVPWVLAVVGVGMTVGNALGGWASDRALRASVLGGLASMSVTLLLFVPLSRSTAGLFVGAFLLGACNLFLGPALQSQLIAAAPRAPLMGAALNQSAMNTANSIGAATGGFVIAQGLGWTAPAWTGAGLAAAGLLMSVAGQALADRTRARRPGGR